MGLLLDLELCYEGMTCEEFTLMAVAGPPRKKLPESVLKRLKQHEDACEYHRSSQFIQSVISTPVTNELTQAAEEIIGKYNLLDLGSIKS